MVALNAHSTVFITDAYLITYHIILLYVVSVLCMYDVAVANRINYEYSA